MELADLRARGWIELLDHELARALSRLDGEPDHEVALAVALTSRHVRRGHACFPLARTAEELWPAEAAGRLTLPSPAAWSARLRRSRLTNAGPLVLDDADRLYLRRYWELERGIAEELGVRAGTSSGRIIDDPRLPPALDRLFGGDDAEPARRAAIHALRERVSLLCGGPGTGKTTTVAAVVALLVERALWERGAIPRVLLLAPTGKAAARLGDAVASAKERIDAPPEVLEAIPDEASTVHRALGKRPTGMRFHRDADAPLDADVIVLDEASMIDLASMRQLLAATPHDATLLLVGDPDQLTSVEAGSVLRDLVDASERTWWSGRVTELVKTYRYDQTLPLGRLVASIRTGDAGSVEAVLDEGAGDVVWLPSESLGDELDRAAELWRDALAHDDPSLHFEARGQFVTLTPFRQGRIGTRALGEALEERLHALGRRSRNSPILIEQNDAELGVYNGDFAMRIDGETPVAVLSSSSGATREIAEARLPRYSSAYALSVHKSQGSEFDEVLVVLPEEDAPLLTRELLYTAVSRARRRVRIVGPKEVVRAALARRARRDSGLVDAIAKLDDGTRNTE